MAANRITTLSTELTRLSVQATRLELPWWQPPGHRALPTGQQVNCNGNAIRREVWLRTAEGRKVSSSYLTPKIAACQLVASRQTRTDRRGRNWRLNSARRPFRERKTINILKLPPAARLSATSFDLTCLINSSANKTSERGGTVARPFRHQRSMNTTRHRSHSSREWHASKRAASRATTAVTQLSRNVSIPSGKVRRTLQRVASTVVRLTISRCYFRVARHRSSPLQITASSNLNAIISRRIKFGATFSPSERPAPIGAGGQSRDNNSHDALQMNRDS